MTRSMLYSLAGLLLLAASVSHAASPGTAFTYQGRLTDNGAPANGTYDVRLILYNAGAGGSQVGPILTNSAANVAGGLFTASLDFGAVFDGNGYWLEISVRTNGGGVFILLNPRQPLTPTPYAQFAPSAGAAATAASAGTAAAVGVGAVTSAGLVDGAVTGAKIADGTVTPADLNLGAFNTTFWQVNGNAGTTPGASFLGTTDSQPVELRVNNKTALRLQPSFGIPNLIAGSASNSAALGIEAATISGGGLDLFPNTVGASYGTVGGGTFNAAGGVWSTIAGGRDNSALADHSTVAGGRGNVIQTNASYAAIGGGLFNVIQTNAPSATIAGGTRNQIQTNAGYSAIGGGILNVIQTNAQSATIAGGDSNQIQTNASDSVIGGGNLNRIQPDAFYTTISGGNNNLIQTNAYGANIAGGVGNSVQPYANNAAIGGGVQNVIGSFRATIGGGAYNLIQGSAQHSSIGGGYTNSIRNGSYGATISGGVQNTIQTNSYQSVIGGGLNNTISDTAWQTTLGGGYGNLIETFAYGSFLGGGQFNVIQSNASISVIVGGSQNTIQTNASYSFIGGGFDNTIQTNASVSVIGGGSQNTIQTNAHSSIIAGGELNSILADAFFSAIGGGEFNSASGPFATTPGGYHNTAANYAFAAGFFAAATNSGAFVWADHSSGFPFGSGNDNSFNVRAAGGVRLETGGAGMTVDGVPVLSGTVATGQIADSAVTSAKIQAGAIIDSDVSASANIDAGKLGTGIVSTGEFNMLDGVTNSLQGQLNQKLFTTGGTMSGTLTFSGALTGIQFPAVSGATSPMITMFASGTANSERSVIAHSPGFTAWGLIYNDLADEFRFNGSTSNILNVGMFSGRVGVGRVASANALEVEGNASKTTATAWLANSDKRIKKDVHPLTHALDVINRVRPVGFHYEEDYRKEHPGIQDVEYYNVVAQEFAEVFPDSVHQGGDTLANGDRILQVDTYPATIYSIAAIQELDHKLQQRNDRVSELEKRNASLEARLSTLEALLNGIAAKTDAH